MQQLWNEFEKDTGQILNEYEKGQVKHQAIRFFLDNDARVAISYGVSYSTNPKLYRKILIKRYYDEAVKRKNHERDQDLTREC